MTRTKPQVLVGILLCASGCAPTFTDAARNGIIFYCPGAGNVDFGDAGIREGMQAAGYRGQIGAVIWTVSLNPAIDQTLRINARIAAGSLARTIEAYNRKFPGKQADIIGLSAGTGVAIWALEDLRPDSNVNNVVLLGSSLSSDYDISKAARRVKGKIYVYHSPNDLVLAGPMKLFGTIDGKWGVEGAGVVGLHSPRAADRVVNIPWRKSFEQLGYYGGHVDSTSPRFVQNVLAKHIIAPADATPQSGSPTAANPPRTTLQAASNHPAPVHASPSAPHPDSASAPRSGASSAAGAETQLEPHP